MIHPTSQQPFQLPRWLDLSANTSMCFHYWKGYRDLPRLPVSFDCMPCSLTPEAPYMSAQYRHARWSFRVFGHPQPPQINSLNEAQSLQHKAYGLQPPCLRLTHVVTNVSSRLGMGCAGSALSQSHSQRPANKHFVAHPK